MNIYSCIVCMVLIIDPALLNGKWKIESYPAYDFLLASSLKKGIDSDQ